MEKALLLLCLTSSSVFANTGGMSFIGSISESTCNMVGEQDGQLGNNIDLGIYSTSQVNTGLSFALPFNLLGIDNNGSICTDDFVDISWIPSDGWTASTTSWGAYGIKNKGTAKNVIIRIMDKNSVELNSQRDNITYKKGDIINGRLPFKTQIVSSNGKTTAGTVIATTHFAVAYR